MQNILVISPQQLTFAIGPNGNVALLMEYDSSHAPWLAPDMSLAIEMTPEEARMIGRKLLAKADAAEAR
ncbi:MAG: hypothetical protein ACI9LT_003626 [Pseudoalteromonas distincta]